VARQCRGVAIARRDVGLDLHAGASVRAQREAAVLTLPLRFKVRIMRIADR
jgi:hypothetical protein